MKLEKQMVPVGVGLTVLGIGLSLGHNCGYAVNPARDLAPRVFTFLAGWGTGLVWTRFQARVYEEERHILTENLDFYTFGSDFITFVFQQTKNT